MVDAAGDVEAPYDTKLTRWASKRMSSSESDKGTDSGMIMLLARVELGVYGPGLLSCISDTSVFMKRRGCMTLSLAGISISGSKGSSCGALGENEGEVDRACGTTRITFGG